jgi:hypothetical protein
MGRCLLMSRNMILPKIMMTSDPFKDQKNTESIWKISRMDFLLKNISIFPRKHFNNT